MAFSDIRYYVSLLFGTNSLMLHVIILYVIVLSSARRLFKGVFWQTYAINSLYSVIMSIAYDLIHRWRNEPLVAHFVLTYLPSEGFVPAFVKSLFDITCIGMTSTQLLINFNRFTVLYLRQKYTHFWKQYYLWFHGFIILQQIVVSTNAWFLNVKITRDEDDYKWDGTRVVPYFRMGNIIFVNTVLSTAISMVFTTYMLVSMISNRRRLMNEFKIKKSDIKLCLFSSIMFLGYSGTAFSQLAFVFGVGGDISYQQTMMYQSYFVDLSVYMSPWALLCTSTLLQRALRALFRCSLNENIMALNSTVVKGPTVIGENSFQKPRH